MQVRALDRVLRASHHPRAALGAPGHLARLLRLLPPPGRAAPLRHRRADDLVGGRGALRRPEGRRNPPLIMGAYVLRRLLLIVPTLFGILLVNFVLVQFMPGGPVEQVLAELQQEGNALDRISGGGGGGGGGARARRRLPGRPGPAAGVHRRAGAAVRLRQAALAALPADAAQLPDLRFRRELLPLGQRRRPGAREDAGLDQPRPLVDAARLPDLDPARHPQGDEGRQPLRHRDQRRHHRRLRHPLLPLRGDAPRPLRRRLLLEALPAARPHLRQLGGALAHRQGARLLLAHHPAGDRLDHRRLRHHDAADQELASSTRSRSST